MNRVRQISSIEPGKIGVYRPKNISGQQPDWLVQRCGMADFSLHGLVVTLTQRGMNVDCRTMWELRSQREAQSKRR
jgi:transposase